jgi:hypothetical protein
MARGTIIRGYYRGDSVSFMLDSGRIVFFGLMAGITQHTGLAVFALLPLFDNPRAYLVVTFNTGSHGGFFP